MDGWFVVNYSSTSGETSGGPERHKWTLTYIYRHAGSRQILIHPSRVKFSSEDQGEKEYMAMTITRTRMIAAFAVALMLLAATATAHYTIDDDPHSHPKHKSAFQDRDGGRGGRAGAKPPPTILFSSLIY